MKRSEMLELIANKIQKCQELKQDFDLPENLAQTILTLIEDYGILPPHTNTSSDDDITRGINRYKNEWDYEYN